MAKYRKCEFVRSYVEYFGHVVGSGELRADPDKFSAIADWAAPRDIKGVLRFLGFANYYNHFIRRFALVAAPISKLLL